jgi:hypothetical protein
MTTVTGWAAELANKLVADTAEALSAYSAAIELMQGGLVLGWDGYGSISVPAFLASAQNGGFVEEGQPIPVRQFAGTAKIIAPHKAASISVLTREMMESSNAEALITDALVKSAGLAIDAAFFDAVAGDAARPAGIRNGIATSPPSGNADPFWAYFEDLSTLLSVVGQVGGNGPYYIVGSAARIGSMAARGTNQSKVIPIISASVGNDLIAVAGQAIAAAVSPDPDVETSPAAQLVMDTAPGPVYEPIGGFTQGERSLFQTESVGIKVRWPASWIVRDARGVAWTTPAWT